MKQRILKFTKFLRSGGKSLLKLVKILLLGVLILAAFTVFVFLRHRQLCTYNDAVSQQLLMGGGSDLCPALTDPSNWGKIVLNAINPTVLSNVAVSSGETTGQASQPSCTDPLNPLCWVGDAKPKLKQTDGFTNFLLIGVDSRNVFSRLMNTDTIMLVTYQHSTGKLMFLSFPRDLYLKYKRLNGLTVSYKINGIYAIDGVGGLNYTLEQVTGRKIHYYAYINIDLFRRAVDALGGIDITLKEPFRDAYPCSEVPAGITCHKDVAGGFGIYTFPAGKNHFDSFQTMVYARSRELSSDYDRARRQQEVIKAIIAKVLHSDAPITDTVSTYLKLYNIFREEVNTNIELQDFVGLFSLINDVDVNALNLVADPSLADGSLIRYLGIKPQVGFSIGFIDESYAAFKKYILKIWDNLVFYLEKPRILVISQKDAKLPAGVKNLIKSPPPFTTLTTITKDQIDIKGLRIYDLSNGKNSGTVDELQRRIEGSLVYNSEIDGITATKWRETVVIIVGN